MTIFSDKLDGLHDTVRLGRAAGHDSIAAALAKGRKSHAVAIGSGGSAVAAQYLAVCRDTLGCPSTSVQTPMRFVLGTEHLAADEQVWLFSARGENADVLAALDAASARGVLSIHVVTGNPSGRLAVKARASRLATVHETPVADPKDGFLATHSLVAAITALLLASDRCAIQPSDDLVAAAFLEETRFRLGADRHSRMSNSMAGFARSDALILLTDPRLSPMATYIETSAWEACLCPVQATDFRNFAHGRHVWLARRAEEAFVLAVTAPESLGSWHEIDSQLPEGVRRLTIERRGCDRFETALSVIDAFAIVEALGATCGIDPGKPGHGTFAKPIYEGGALLRASDRLTAPARQKWAAIQDRSHPSQGCADIGAAASAFRDRLSKARFRNLVLDYDGTIVTTAGRFEPPSPAIVGELSRLLEEGMTLGIATGRGGSAGEMLRTALPRRFHASVQMGYYNGGFVRSLDVDIRTDPPAADPEIAKVSSWLDGQRALFRNFKYRNSGVQITIDATDLVDPDRFLHDLQAYLPGADDRLRVARSQHSFDVVPASTTKTAVVARLEAAFDCQATICVGDSGEWGGNDHVLLGERFGVSVDRVCHRVDVCWSLFGHSPKGPEALVRILLALVKDDDKGHFLDMAALDGTS